MRLSISNKLSLVLSYVVTNYVFDLFEAINWFSFENSVVRTLVIIFVTLLGVQFVVDKEEADWQEDKPKWEIKDEKAKTKAK